MRTSNLPSGPNTSNPAWGNRAANEPRWPATAALLAALVLYVTLPDKLIFGLPGVSPAIARWVVPALEVVLIAILQVTRPHHRGEETPARRSASIAVIGLLNLANLGSLVLLVDNLVHGTLHQHGVSRYLLYSSVLIWLTNVIIFGLWYWELDRGGPGARCLLTHREPDFLFPQMITPQTAPAGWSPSFFDYLYVSLTNATAFSPTDTMPLTETAKGLMLVQSLASLLIVALVAARAVNILGS